MSNFKMFFVNSMDLLKYLAKRHFGWQVYGRQAIGRHPFGQLAFGQKTFDR
jgi:hypothetical protein